MKADESKILSVRVSIELADWFTKIAKSNYRTASAELLKMIEEKRNDQSKAA